jgi:PAS domain S-box-containing protein
MGPLVTLFDLGLVLVAAGIAVAAWRLARRSSARAEELRATGEKYRAVMGQLPDTAVLVFDRDLRYTMMEGDALESRGWRRDELIGKKITEVLPAGRGEQVIAAYREALAGHPSAFEWPSTRTAAVFRIEVRPLLRSRGGAIDRGLCIVRDVTAQHDMRVELESQRGFLAAALEQLSEPVVIADAEARITVVNAAARQMYRGDGTTADVDPLDWAARFGLGDESGNHSLGRLPLWRALQGETVRDDELAVTTADGALRRLLISAGPVVGHDGRRLGAVLAANDVTDRHAAEDALRASEERYRSVVQGMRDVVFQLDLRGRWTFLNEAWTRVTGHAVGDTLGRPCWEVVHPDDRATHSAAVEALMGGDSDDGRVTVRYLTADGAVRWLAGRAQLLRNGAGEPTAIAGVMEDVSDQVRGGHYEAAEHAVLAALATATDRDTGVGLVLEQLARNLEWDAAELWVRDGDHLVRDGVWHGSLVRDTPEVDAIRLEVGDGLPGQAWARRSPLWVPALETGFECPRSAAAVRAGLRSGLAVPVTRGRVVEGIILLFSTTERVAEKHLGRPLGAIAAHVAHFLERSRTDRDIAEHSADLAALSHVAHELASQTDLDAARAAICQATVDVSGAAIAALLEPEGDMLNCVAFAGPALDADAELPPLGQSRGARRALDSGTPLFVGDVQERPELVTPWVTLTDSRAVYWQPLMHEGRALGVLAIAWTEPRTEVSARIRELVRLLAADGSLAVTRARMLAELQRAARPGDAPVAG